MRVLRVLISALLLSLPLVLAATTNETEASTESLDVVDQVFLDVVELAVRTNIINETQKDQLRDLFDSKLAAARDAASKPGTVATALTTVSGSITLLNVLYVGGALIIMGGMTLFMTLGWESFGGGGIFVVSSAYIACFLYMGNYCWQNENRKVVGGLLYTIAVSIVPLATYGFQRMAHLWPKSANNATFSEVYHTLRAPWIPMEITTSIAGIYIASKIPFSFILAPVSVALWFASMDIIPLLFPKGTWGFSERSKVSAIFGFDMILAAWILDSPTYATDYSFWLYLFGSIAFIGGTVEQLLQHNLTRETIFLCAQVAILYYGVILDRAVLTFFGFLAVTAYFFWQAINFKNTLVSWSAVYLRAAASVLLLAMSLYSYTNTGYGNAEYLLGLMGFIVYNLTWAKNAPLASEVTYLFHLCTNIGVISTAALFNHSISLYLFSIDGQWPLIVIGVLGIIGNSTSALFFELEFDYRNTYCTYRVALGVLLSLLSFALPRNPIGLVWAGTISVLEYTWIALAWKLPNLGKRRRLIIGHFFNCLIGVILSSIWDIRALFIASVGMLVFVHHHAWRNLRWFFFLASVSLLPFAVVLNSKLLLAVAGLSIAAFLSKLAKTVFRSKLLFPFVLVAIGGGVIYFGMLYQEHHELLRSELLRILHLDQLTTDVVHFFELLGRIDAEWSKTIALLGWTAPVILFFASDIAFVPVALFGLAALSLGSEFIATVMKEEPLDENAPPKIEITQFDIYFPSDTEDHGLVLAFQGTKPANFTLDSCTLYVDGDRLWSAMESLAGSTLLSTVKLAFYPLKLIPSRTSKSYFKSGQTEVKGYIQLLTGVKGEARVSHATIRSMLRKLVNYGDPSMTIKVVYSSKSARPKRGVLFSTTTTASRTLNSIKTNLKVADVTKGW